MSRIYFFLLIIFVLFPTLSDGQRSNRISGNKELPPPIFDLFYKIKNSLDYGRLDSDPIRKPKKDISEHLTDKFRNDYYVESYKVLDEDYELIVVGNKNKDVRYKATRYRKYKYSDGKWLDFGEYIYY